MVLEEDLSSYQEVPTNQRGMAQVVAVDMQQPAKQVDCLAIPEL